MLQCQANKKKHHHRTAHYLNIIQKHQICSNNATGSMYKKQDDSKDILLWCCSCLFLMDIQLSHSGTIDAFQSHQRSKWWTAYRNLKVEARDFVPIVSPQPTTDTKVDCSSDKSQAKKTNKKTPFGKILAPIFLLLQKSVIHTGRFSLVLAKGTLFLLRRKAPVAFQVHHISWLLLSQKPAILLFGVLF